MSRQKAAEWLHQVEFNLRISTVPQDRWVRLAVNKVDSYFQRVFEGWEQEEPALNWSCFRNLFIKNVAGTNASVFVAIKRLNRCRQQEGENALAFFSRFEQEMQGHRETLMHLPENLRINDFQYYQTLVQNVLGSVAYYLNENESKVKNLTDLTPEWARDRLSHM